MLLQASLLVLSLGAIAQGASRIIGGHDAPNHKYPYIVYFRDNVRGHFCAGTILNERWILSSAACLDRRKLESFTIVAGTNYLNEKGTTYLPQFYIKHENYRDFMYYDIALVRLKSDVVFTNYVKPIALPDENFQEYNGTAWLAGWGRTKLAGSTSNALQEIEFNVLKSDNCKRRLNGIDGTHVCTLNKINEGVCFGDGGDPLVINDVQIGISSWMVACALNYPDVHTRVSAYRNWIDSILALNIDP